MAKKLTKKQIEEKVDIIEKQLKTIYRQIEQLDGVEIVDRDELDDKYTSFTKALNRLNEAIDEIRWY